MSKNDNEERYVLTPKGCATAALLNMGLVKTIEDSRIDAFWVLFETYMDKAGYITKE